MQSKTGNRFSFLKDPIADKDDDKDMSDNTQDNAQRSKNMFLTKKTPVNMPNNNFRNASSLFKPIKKEENDALPQKNSRWGYLENEIMEEKKFRDEKNMFKSNDRDRNDRDRHDRDRHGNYRKSFFQSSKRKKTPPPKKFAFVENDFPSLS